MTDILGKKVLLVEDEALIAISTLDMLESAGAIVDGPYRKAQEAIEILDGDKPDLAVLDVDLGTHNSLDLARLLDARGIPYLFMTGFGSRWSDQTGTAPVISKPFSETRLLDLLQGMLA